MRILVVSNLYPPFFIGGYEIGCMQIVDALQEKGHEVFVLTSDFGTGRVVDDRGVLRLLRFNSDPQYLPRQILVKEIHNQRTFRKICRDYRPDVCFFWNLMGISVSLPVIASKLNIPIAYYVFDGWLVNWKFDQWVGMENESKSRKAAKTIGRILQIEAPSQLPSLRHAIFASNFLKNAAIMSGIATDANPVVWWGIDVNRFRPQEKVINSSVNLLYVGQIIRHKGVHTVVEAFALLNRQIGQYYELRLSIVGDMKQVPEYADEIKQIIDKYGLDNKVICFGKVDNEQLPEVYEDHHIFIFSSIWDEPFGITLLEAMSSGLAVVGTATGGSAEIMKHEINSLVFEKNNPESCSNQIKRLVLNPQLFKSICSEGRKTAETNFVFDITISHIESHLQHTRCFRSKHNNHSVDFI